MLGRRSDECEYETCVVLSISSICDNWDWKATDVLLAIVGFGSHLNYLDIEKFVLQIKCLYTFVGDIITPTYIALVFILDLYFLYQN